MLLNHRINKVVGNLLLLIGSDVLSGDASGGWPLSSVGGPERMTDRTVDFGAVLPVGDYLATGGAMSHLAVAALVALSHVLQHVSHRLTVRHCACAIRTL